MNKLEQIKKECHQIISFIKNLNSSTEEDIVFFQQIENIINKAYLKKDLKGLNSIRSDFNELIDGLEVKDMSELHEILENLNLSNSVSIESIIKKGKIQNEKQYRLVIAFIEKNYYDNSPSFKNRINKLNQFLVEWEGNKGNGGK